MPAPNIIGFDHGPCGKLWYIAHANKTIGFIATINNHDGTESDTVCD